MEACTAAMLVGVMRPDCWAGLSMVPGAWSVCCADWRSFRLIVGVSYLLCSFAVPRGCGFLRARQVHTAMTTPACPNS